MARRCSWLNVCFVDDDEEHDGEESGEKPEEKPEEEAQDGRFPFPFAS